MGPCGGCRLSEKAKGVYVVLAVCRVSEKAKRPVWGSCAVWVGWLDSQRDLFVRQKRPTNTGKRDLLTQSKETYSYWHKRPTNTVQRDLLIQSNETY